MLNRSHKLVAMTVIALGMAAAASQSVSAQPWSAMKLSPSAERVYGYVYYGDSRRASDANCLGRQGAQIVGGYADSGASATVDGVCRY